MNLKQIPFIGYKRMTYHMDIIQQIAYLVFNQIVVESYGFLFICTIVCRVSDSVMVPTSTFHWRADTCC